MAGSPRRSRGAIRRYTPPINTRCATSGARLCSSAVTSACSIDCAICAMPASRASRPCAPPASASLIAKRAHAGSEPAYDTRASTAAQAASHAGRAAMLSATSVAELGLHSLDRRPEAFLAAREVFAEARLRDACARADRRHAHAGIARVIGRIDDPAEQALALGALAWLSHLAVACPLPARRASGRCPLCGPHRLYRRSPWDTPGDTAEGKST